tara:strand:+ start:1838 stop:1996 length:159 start_codon:yes stop_codon:yes gene_type:complete
MASRTEVFPDPFSPQITVNPLQKSIFFSLWFLKEDKKMLDMAKKNRPPFLIV